MIILIIAGIIVILLLVLLLIIFKTEESEEVKKPIENEKVTIQENSLIEVPQREIIKQPVMAIETPQKLDTDPVVTLEKMKSKKYRNAGEKWTKSQEQKLKKMLLSGQTPAEIAKSLKRRVGAIRSKMRQLNLA